MGSLGPGLFRFGDYMARRFGSEVHVAARLIAEIPRTSEKVEILGARRGRHPLGEG